jgi:hypothetical protein
MGYKWESSRTSCTLTAPDGTKIPLMRNRYNGFWYFNALKIHHDTDLTRKEIGRQLRHYKTTSLYLPLTLMTKYKKSKINSQPVVVKLPTARTNLKALPQAIEITGIKEDTQYSCPHELGDNQETGGWEPYHWTGTLENYTRPTNTSV